MGQEGRNAMAPVEEARRARASFIFMLLNDKD